jgi:hypothetical protein
MLLNFNNLGNIYQIKVHPQPSLFLSGKEVISPLFQKEKEKVEDELLFDKYDVSLPIGFCQVVLVLIFVFH